MEKVYFWGGMAVGRVRFAANVDSKQHVDGKTQAAGKTHYKTVTNRVLIMYASIDYTLAIFDFHADLTNLTKNASLHSRLPSG